MKITKEYFAGNKDKTIKILIIAVIILAAAFVFLTRTDKDEISLEKSQTTAGDQESSGTGSDESSEENEESSSDIVICDVSGAVKTPKVVELKKGSRISDAIDSAGGLTGKADITNINRAAIVNDGDKIYIPEAGESSQVTAETNNGVNNSSTDSTSGQNDPQANSDQNNGANASGTAGDTRSSGKINLNSADSAALQQINGIGPVTADKIIEYRNDKGAFTKLEQLKEISGIGEKTFEKLKEEVTI